MSDIKRLNLETLDRGIEESVLAQVSDRQFCLMVLERVLYSASLKIVKTENAIENVGKSPNHVFLDEAQKYYSKVMTEKKILPATLDYKFSISQHGGMLLC